MANAYQKAGKLDKAGQLWEQIYEVAMEKGPENNRLMLAAMNHLAIVYVARSGAGQRL